MFEGLVSFVKKNIDKESNRFPFRNIVPLEKKTIESVCSINSTSLLFLFYYSLSYFILISYFTFIYNPYLLVIKLILTLSAYTPLLTVYPTPMFLSCNEYENYDVCNDR